MEGGCYLKLADGTLVKADELGNPLEQPVMPAQPEKLKPIAAVVIESTTANSSEGSQ